MSRITRILEHGSTNTRPSIRWRGPIALSLGALIAAGCIGNAAEAAPYTAVQDDARQERTTGPVNTTCPITGKEVNSDSPRVDVRGYTVAFCCNNCVAKFNDNPRKYLTSMREAGVSTRGFHYIRPRGRRGRISG
jgi:YHS domain-containing protein